MGTIYERLGDLTESSQAVARALGNPQARRSERAELLALSARNAKKQWLPDWRGLPAGQRQPAALRSPRLDEAITAYADGYAADQNHYYSGLNALALLTVANELAVAVPDAWQERFATDTDATTELSARQTRASQFAAAVALSVAAAREQAQRTGSKGRLGRYQRGRPSPADLHAAWFRRQRLSRSARRRRRFGGSLGAEAARAVSASWASSAPTSRQRCRCFPPNRPQLQHPPDPSRGRSCSPGT